MAYALADAAAAITLGINVVASDSTAGAIQPSSHTGDAASTDEMIIGHAVGAAAASKPCPIMITGLGI